jgi:hypothetical protein
VEAGRPVTLEVHSRQPVSIQFGEDGPLEVAEPIAPAEQIVMLEDGEELLLSIVEPNPTREFASVRGRVP